MNDSPTIITNVPKECELCKFHTMNGTSGIKESLPISLQQLKAEICHCVPVYSIIATNGLIAMGFPFCPRCGGKLSAV